MLKNLGLGMKIFAGFACILVLLVAGSVVSWNALNEAQDGFVEYRGLARDANLSGRLQANMLMVRMNVKDFLITGADKDIQQYDEYFEKMAGFMAEAQTEIQKPERAALVDSAEDMVDQYGAAFEQVKQYMAERDTLVNDVLNVKGPLMEDNLTGIMTSAHEDEDLAAAYLSGIAMRHMMLARLYMAKFLDTNDPSAVERVNKELETMAANLTILNENLENSERRGMLATVVDAQKTYSHTFNELVATINARNKLIEDKLDRLGPEIAEEVEGVKLSVKTDQDALGPRLQASNERAVKTVMSVSAGAIVFGIILALLLARSITGPINRIINGLNDGADQVNDAAEQVSTASQQLAAGASEQASSLEETSSALEEITAMTRTNASRAQEANELSAQSHRDASSGNETMGAISESSGQINKIIKVIEEIAFQTNLLALNAAVEAARAGEHGKGFAVVADEVRNLAQRAAAASREITGLIEDSVSRAREGTNAMEAIVGGVAKVSELIEGIATASEEQAQGVDQVNTAVSQMDKVTQQNAAGAEESASAAEELSAQAGSVKAIVGELIGIVRGAKANTSVSLQTTSRRNAKKRTAVAALGGAPVGGHLETEQREAGYSSDEFASIPERELQDF